MTNCAELCKILYQIYQFFKYKIVFLFILSQIQSYTKSSCVPFLYQLQQRWVHNKLEYLYFGKMCPTFFFEKPLKMKKFDIN